MSGSTGDIERGTGRHGVPNASYVYRHDPDGQPVKVCTSGYSTGDPDHEVLRWDVRDPRRQVFWGNAVVEPWYRDASPGVDLDRMVRPVIPFNVYEVSAYAGADGSGTSGPVGDIEEGT
ncbi:MAG: hypothetical protein ACRDY3_08900 [Acidimicrobiales bacterium]